MQVTIKGRLRSDAIDKLNELVENNPNIKLRGYDGNTGWNPIIAHKSMRDPDYFCIQICTSKRNACASINFSFNYPEGYQLGSEIIKQLLEGNPTNGKINKGNFITDYERDVLLRSAVKGKVIDKIEKLLDIPEQPEIPPLVIKVIDEAIQKGEISLENGERIKQAIRYAQKTFLTLRRIEALEALDRYIKRKIR